MRLHSKAFRLDALQHIAVAGDGSACCHFNTVERHRTRTADRDTGLPAGHCSRTRNDGCKHLRAVVGADLHRPGGNDARIGDIRRDSKGIAHFTDRVDRHGGTDGSTDPRFAQGQGRCDCNLHRIDARRARCFDNHITRCRQGTADDARRRSTPNGIGDPNTGPRNGNRRFTADADTQRRRHTDGLYRVLMCNKSAGFRLQAKGPAAIIDQNPAIVFLCFRQTQTVIVNAKDAILLFVDHPFVARLVRNTPSAERIDGATVHQLHDA